MSLSLSLSSFLFYLRNLGNLWIFVWGLISPQITPISQISKICDWEKKTREHTSLKGQRTEKEEQDSPKMSADKQDTGKILPVDDRGLTLGDLGQMSKKMDVSKGEGEVDATSAKTRRETSEAEIRASTVGEIMPLKQPIFISEYDPEWPRLFEREAKRVRAALGDEVLMLEHVGSTSVPGLAAKPRIDMLLVVPNSADEPSYVPMLEAAGYVLRIREPDWYEHRVFKGPDTDVNLHVFSQSCPEIQRMLLFRDWLRTHPSDREYYERTKRELAGKEWKYVQNYADAKTEVVEEIIARARGGGL
jgi:GrpB-like predicted nucleotidyltransferase (UPF0157 family)